MLKKVTKLDERITTGPAGTWYRDKLWLAYGSLDTSLIVQSIDVRGSLNTIRRATGFTAGTTTAVTAWNDRLYILFGAVDQGYQLTSTSDGITFTSPRDLPIPGFTGIAGITSHPGGLVVLWAENAGGHAHILQSDDGGASFTNVTLPFAVLPEPSVTFDPAAEELILTYGVRKAGANSLTVLAVKPNDPNVALRVLTIPTPLSARGTAICATNYHNKPGLHIAAQEAADTGIGVYSGRTAFTNLEAVGGEERFLSKAHRLSLTNDGIWTWVAWRGDTDDLWIAPYILIFDLPEELKARLGEECDERDCPIDPRLVCEATNEVVWRENPPMIQNAYRGDLVLTPGDGTGVIATILDQLDPKQFFDHMGIMVKDKTLIRHATMAHDRVQKRQPGRFMTGDFYGEPAPVDGFVASAITYGWPGTITQSIEDAFFIGFNTINPATDRPYNKQGDYFEFNSDQVIASFPTEGTPEEEWEKWRQQQSFADPEYPSEDYYQIKNLPPNPAYRMDIDRVIDAVVLKPLPSLEAENPRIRATLHRIADIAEQIQGHYRFYCYTEGGDSLNSSKFGPTGTWAAATRPMVCSSFVWTAIQLANAQMPLIEVEGNVTEDPQELLASPNVDGLYRYLSSERTKAAHALHSYMSERVRKEVYLALQQAEHEGRLVIDILTIGLSGLVALLAGPVAAAATLLGVSPGTITDLKVFFEDMPDDVATQFCNVFAKDRADETDEDLWQSPGDGLAVSPDDIKNYWDPPSPNNANRQKWHGLYSYAEKMFLTKRRHDPVRRHRWAKSKGPAYVQGTVIYQGEPIEGARVSYGCEFSMTNRMGGHVPLYNVNIGAGSYEAVATAYWPTSEEMLTGRRLVEIRAGDQPGLVDIELQDPPDWRRKISCTGKIDLVRRVGVGKDDWAHSPINLHETMTKAPKSWGPPPKGASTLEWSDKAFSDFAQRFNVRVDIRVVLLDDLSIDVYATSRLCAHYYDHTRLPNGDEVVTAGEFPKTTIAPGETKPIVFDHESGNFPPDRAHVEFKVSNFRAPA